MKTCRTHAMSAFSAINLLEGSHMKISENLSAPWGFLFAPKILQLSATDGSVRLR